MQFAQNAGILELVRHGHGIHEAGNGLVVKRDLVCGGVDGDHFAAQLVNLIGGIGGRVGSGLLPGVAPNQRDKSEQ